MHYGEVFRACDNGSVYASTPEQLREMLQALTRLSGPNPSPHAKAARCSELIRHQLDQIAADRRAASSLQRDERDRSERWYKKPVGMVMLSVAAGLVLLVIKLLLGI